MATYLRVSSADSGIALDLSTVIRRPTNMLMENSIAGRLKRLTGHVRQASILIALLIFTSCVNSPRLKTSNALDRLREIRKAQETYRQSVGENSYGSLGELVNAGLVSGALSDGEDWGYRFHLSVDGATYRIIAEPIGQEPSETAYVRFYMDESGVIRATFQSSVTPDKNSDPIRNQ